MKAYERLMAYAAYPTASDEASETVPSTPMLPVSRFTEQEETPSREETAFSTLLLQAAQLMPVTVKRCICSSPFVQACLSRPAYRQPCCQPRARITA